MLTHIFNPSTCKAKAGGILVSSRPARSTQGVPGQPRLHSESLLGKSGASLFFFFLFFFLFFLSPGESREKVVMLLARVPCLLGILAPQTT